MWYTNKNHAAYIKGWKNRAEFLKEDNRLLMRAISQSQKAADYILNLDKEGNPAYLKNLKFEENKEEKPKKNNKLKPKKKPKTKNKPTSKNAEEVKPQSKKTKKAQKKTKKEPKVNKKTGQYALLGANTAKKKEASKPQSEVKNRTTPHNGIGLIGIKNQIKISTENFKEFSTPELRAFILKYYNLFLKNKTLAIKNSLQKVELLSRAGRKISKGSAAYKAKAAVIEHFEVVLKNSTYNNWGEPKPKDSPDLLGYMNFKSKVNIDGKNRHVRISVEVFKDKKTLLKSYEVGKKKPHLSKESQKLSSSPNEVIKSDKKPLSYSKDTKKEVSKPQNDVKNKLNQNHKPGLQVGQPLPQPLPQPVEYPVNKNSLAARMAANKNKVYNYYTISNPELSKFLGKIEIKEKESVGISITAPQGAGKTRFLFQVIDAFADHYKVGHASMEEHPDSSLYTSKVEQYIKPENFANIEAPEIKTMADLHGLIMRNDIIAIDSFEKLREINKQIEVDKDLRKKYDGKLFIFIFQMTSDGKMRGGSKSQFDVDIVLFTEKFDDYRENYIYVDKNRYNELPATDLKYSIYHKAMLVPEPSGNLPQPEADPQVQIKPTGNLILTEF